MLTVIKGKNCRSSNLFLFTHTELPKLYLITRTVFVATGDMLLHLTDLLNSQIRVNSSGKGINQDK